MADSIIPQEKEAYAYSKAQTDTLISQSTATLDAETYNSGSSVVYKVGRICYISCIAGTWSNNGAGTAIYTSGKSGWVLPEGFRPKINCEIREALVGKRITVLTTGEVTCPEAISGVNLRFSGCYINA